MDQRRMMSDVKFMFVLVGLMLLSCRNKSTRRPDITFNLRGSDRNGSVMKHKKTNQRPKGYIILHGSHPVAPHALEAVVCDLCCVNDSWHLWKQTWILFENSIIKPQTTWFIRDYNSVLICFINQQNHWYSEWNGSLGIKISKCLVLN